MVFVPPTDRLRIERDPDDEAGDLRPIGEIVAVVIEAVARASCKAMPTPPRFWRLARETRAQADLDADFAAVRQVGERRLLS